MRITSLKEKRDSIIEEMDSSMNSTEYAKINSENLYFLGLTVYSKNYSIDSIIYNSFALSCLDSNISLHPEQLKVVEAIKKNEALVLSAPTSFGKTFCVFEYIARYSPKNIVLIVPTLALIDEYIKKIIKKYKYFFKKYKVYSNVIEGMNVDFTTNNIFILTHERIISGIDLNFFKEIDFLVIDEVYKLNTDASDDRVLVLNMAYYYISKISKKYVLLAPFISEIENISLLEKKPLFIRTDFSPVVNKVKTIDIIRDKDRFSVCENIISSEVKENDKTLIYFPTVVSLYKYVNEIISKEPICKNVDSNVFYFLEWAKAEIHNEWAVVKALERGYLIHNGQIQLGTRVFLLDLFDEFDSGYDKLLCTSSLLEGVNTSAKNIIITRPSRRKNTTTDNFSAFDFYNLVGRTGRLYKHLIGNAYYIKGPNDPEYKLSDAKRKIKFEILDDSKDIDVQLGIAKRHKDVEMFYNSLGITNEQYIKNIGTRIRIDSCIELYKEYINYENRLIQELMILKNNDMRGRYYLLEILNRICTVGENQFNFGIKTYILNKLINLNRPSIKSIVDESFNYCKTKKLSLGIDDLISIVINYKTSYIEHRFYNRCYVICYFMEKRKIDNSLIELLKKKVLNPIDILYFTKSPLKKALFDIGIYEKDIDNIVDIIGDTFEDVNELKTRLLKYSSSLKKISFISKYIIKSFK
ncbi:MAG: DEAD/DEAH box helicase [Anaeroplasma sp.]